jgi:CrcB protein
VRWLSIFVGGGLGAVLRYELGGWVQGHAGTALPWGTFAVNALGCLAIGLLATWIDERAGGGPALRAFLLTGVLGGFTTFSAFGLETWRLVESGALAGAAANAVGSMLVCVAAVATGAAIARAAW